MFNRHWRLCAVVLLLPGLLAPPAALASREEKAIVLAEQYYRNDKRRSFVRQAARVAPKSVYQPLVSYWQSILDMRAGAPGAVERYLAGAASPYLKAEARRQLLEYYADEKQWGAFSRHADAGGACAGALKAIKTRRADAGVRVRQLWRNDRRMNAALCLSLYRYAYAAKILGKDDVWVKLRTLAGGRQFSASRRLLSNFPGFISYKKVRAVVRRAVPYIRGKHGLKTRAQRELVMIAAMVAARRRPQTAIARWWKFSRYFSAEENDHVWTVLATWAARWHRDDALQLYAATSGKYADEQSRAWRVRAALRAGDYPHVREMIESMPPAERNLSAWRYWHAIAVQQSAPAAAAALLQALAGDEDDYYGLLAREAVGRALVDSKPPPVIAADARLEGDFKLAIAVHKAGLKEMARTIWRHAARRKDIDKMQLMAAAHWAAQANWPLASIDAAIRADDAAAHHWRYPFLYQEEIIANSEKRGLDVAFVYGLIHQESRFMPTIVSSAKARGLMQVIPSTAHQVARANQYSKYRLSRLMRVDTNVIIGTTYLQELADALGAAPGMVAAAYNAGPRRVRRWYSASDEILVAIENIPITETRLYVKYLLANRLHYTARLGRKLPTMRENIVRPMMAAAS